MATTPDEQYVEEQQIEKKLAEAMAQVLREKPPDAAARLAQLLSPAPAPTDEYLSTIGGTPMVELKKLLPAGCKAKAVYAKMEMQNPGGSIKDRIAKEIIETAEREGKLKPGMTVVEATSGNTGIGLAMCCAAKGYGCVITQVELSMKSTIESISVQLSTRELDDIPENEPLTSSSSKVNPKSAERIIRPQRSSFVPIHSAGSSSIPSNISKVSLTFDDVAQFGRSDLPMRKQSVDSAPSRSARSMPPFEEGSQQSKDVIYNPSVSTMKPNISSLKFLPSSANSSHKHMIVSQSARSLMSGHSSRSGKGNRSARAMSKSLSVDSPRLSSESQIRKYSSIPFKESIPNVFEGEYETKKIPSINDVISRRSSTKNAGSSGGVWVPSDSIVRKTSLVGENLHSPSAVLTSTPSNNTKIISGSQIFVTPVASVNFVPSTLTSSSKEIKTKQSNTNEKL